MDNQGFTEITGEDITYLKTIFPNLQDISLKNNQISKVKGAFNVRNLDINLEGNPLQRIEIETPENCNKLTFSTNTKNLPVEFKQNTFSKIKIWIKSLIAKSKVVTYELWPSYDAFLRGALILGIYKMCKIAAEPFTYDNLERERVIKSLLDKSTEIVPGNMQEEAAIASLKTILESLKLPIIKRPDATPDKLFISRLADVMAFSATLIAACKTLWDIKKALKDSAKKSRSRISVYALNNEGNFNVAAEIPSNFDYNLFGKL